MTSTTTLPERVRVLVVGAGLRRPRHRDQARRARLLRLPRRRQGRHRRRHLARQHLPRCRLRRAQPALLVQLRAQPRLVALVLPAAGDPGLPRAHGRARPGCWTGSGSASRSRTSPGTRTTSVWQVAPTHGDVTADVVITGSGGLSEPKLPEIAGIESFERRDLPLRALEPRLRPHRQAGRRHRHRRLVDPDRARRSPSRSPTSTSTSARRRG